MSLIHDALKKAEQGEDAAKLGDGLSAFKEPVEEKKELPTRTILLAVFLVVAVGAFAYFKFFSSSDESKIGLPSQAASDVGKATITDQIPVAATDAEKLKKSAIDNYNANNFDAAMSTLSTALQLSQTDPELWNNIGLVAKKKGDLVKAREGYERALQLRPEYPEAMNNLGSLEMGAGNLEQARALFDKCLKLAPANPEANFNMGILYEKQNDKKKASEYYRRFVSAAAGFPSSIVDSVRDHIMEIE